MGRSDRQVVFTLKFELDEECRFTTRMLGRLAHSCEGVKKVADDPRTGTLTVEGTADPRSVRDFLKLVVPQSKVFLVILKKPSKNKKSSGVDSKNMSKIQLFMLKFVELFRKAILRKKGGRGSNKIEAEKFNRRQKEKLEKANELQGGRKSRQTSKGNSATDQGSIYAPHFGASAYACQWQEESWWSDDGYVTAAPEFSEM